MVHLLRLFEISDSGGESDHEISDSFEGLWGSIYSEFDEPVVDLDLDFTLDTEGLWDNISTC